MEEKRHLAALVAAVAAAALVACQEGGGGPLAGADPVSRLSAQQLESTVFAVSDERIAPSERPSDPRLGGYSTAAALHMPTAGWIDDFAAAVEAQSAAVVREAHCSDDHCRQRVLLTVAGDAFRRPLTKAENALVLGLYAPGEGGPDLAFAAAVAMVLHLPQSLYRLEPLAPSVGAAVADRLALLLWNGRPDDVLHRAVAEGRLGTLGEVESQVRRMMTREQFLMVGMTFLRQWAGIDRHDAPGRDRALYPGYETRTFMAMADQADAFFRAVLTEAPFYRELLTRATYPVSPELTPVFGPDASGQPHLVDGRGVRAGVLGLPLFLTVRARTKDPSPIRRGTFVLDRLLCRPPLEVPAFSPPFDDKVPGRTNRERTAAQTEGGVCLGCHDSINNAGYAFESFDAIGRHRTEDGELPVDDRWKLLGADTVSEGRGLVSLAETVAESPTARRCFANQWAEFALGGPHAPAQQPVVDEAWAAFEASGGNIRELVVAFSVASVRPLVEGR
jgi:hypothetical protein